VESWEPSQHSLLDTGKPRKIYDEVAGRRNCRILTSSQQYGVTEAHRISTSRNGMLTNTDYAAFCVRLVAPARLVQNCIRFRGTSDNDDHGPAGKFLGQEVRCIQSIIGYTVA
jgi:hypothetical protein